MPEAITETGTRRDTIVKTTLLKGPSNAGLPPRELAAARAVRSETRALLARLEGIREGRYTFASEAGFLRGACADLTEAMSGVSKVAPRGRDAHNLWEAMAQSPIFSRPEEFDVATSALKELAALEWDARDLLFAVSAYALASEVNELLEDSDTGLYIPFHEAFRNEFPNEEDRKQVLKELAWNPKRLPRGVVDPNRGLIYRHSGKMWRALVDTVALALVLVAAFAAVAFLPDRFGIADPAGPWGFARGWLATVAGAAFHAGVVILRQSGGLPPYWSLRRAPFWVQARVPTVYWTVGAGLVATLLLWRFFPTEYSGTACFFMGYTLDTALEGFAAVVEKKAGERVTVVKDRVLKAGA